MFSNSASTVDAPIEVSTLRNQTRNSLVILAVLAIIKFLLTFLIHPEYELHRDEYLYRAMGDHLDWGYLEVPPGIAVFGRLASLLFGENEFGVHFFPALAGALTVIIAGLMAAELGGGRFAQVLSALCVLASPAFQRSSVLFQPVVFDQLYWALGMYLLIRIFKGDDARLWLALGVVAGVGLMNKYTMLLFGAGALVGLLLTQQRKWLATKWAWMAAGIAFFIWAPNLIWQYQQGWPIIDHMQELSRSQLVNVEPAGFLLMQVLMALYAFPIAMIGLWHFLISDTGERYRPLGWIYIIVLAILLFFSGKPYYLLPAYPVLFAAGSVALARRFELAPRRWLKPAIATAVVAGSLPIVPYGIPVLAPETMQKFGSFMANNLGLDQPLRWEDGKPHLLPQDFADMLGWENQVAKVAEVYHRLDPVEKQKCAIIASNYGEAGALEFYGTRHDLPKVISFNGSYYLWGPGNDSKPVMITVGLSKFDLSSYFNEIQEGAVITHPHARENEVPVFIVRRPVMTLQEVWPRLVGERF